jgi:hypothetical protein
MGELSLQTFTVNKNCHLSSQKKELVDLATISDQEIKNDEVIYMVFAKENGGGWEDVQVEALLPFGEESNDHGLGGTSS